MSVLAGHIHWCLTQEFGIYKPLRAVLSMHISKRKDSRYARVTFIIYLLGSVSIILRIRTRSSGADRESRKKNLSMPLKLQIAFFAGGSLIENKAKLEARSLPKGAEDGSQCLSNS